MKKLFIVISVLLVSMGAIAQKNKLAHVDSNAIFALMPEKAEASKAVEEYAKNLETQLVVLNEELEKKYNEYTSSQETMSPSIKKMKEEELMNLQQRIQAFQVSAQEDMQAKEVELLEPIYAKIKDAIKEVGKEKGYLYIFDVTTVLYNSPESTDITPLVKTKLGIK